ncbi:carbohydrate kinase family protein [Oceanispirochaeta sp.]|jgi:sugar/nucleoside kinase (ribokinase family)|uniref:carbohydrate kinase family protein n=1 Tax=Oceanispirochaeta sp. TaxID=2035350 RepID=UPI002626DF87|nr:sugar kinase [Oceanispirochaeta sp.]MDA3955086.1 sugar kinase [Oceanispirochaeta sp.]
MKSSKVVSLGLHICDVLGRPVNGIPPGQSLTILDETRMTVAGTAAGASVDMAKLGLEVYAMGAVGEDLIGEFVESSMKSFGINTAGLIRKKNVQTSTSMLLIRPNGERPALHVPGANACFSLEDVDFDLIAAAGFLHVGGTGLLPGIDGEDTVRILSFAKDKGLVTTFDLIALETVDALPLIIPCLPYIDYFMPGLEEAVLMCGFDDRQKLHRFFLEKGAGHTVFKNGEKGSFIGWLEGGELKELHIPCFEAEIVDSTGCGDSYCGGFIKALSRGMTLEECGRIGSACGALVISGLGSDAGIKDWEQVLNFSRISKTSIPAGEKK